MIFKHQALQGFCMIKKIVLISLISIGSGCWGGIDWSFKQKEPLAIEEDEGHLTGGITYIPMVIGQGGTIDRPSISMVIGQVGTIDCPSITRISDKPNEKNEKSLEKTFIQKVEERLANGERGTHLNRRIEDHPWKDSPVGCLAFHPEQIDLLKRLLQAGAPVESDDLEGSIMVGSANQVELLLAYGADPNNPSLPLSRCGFDNTQDPIEKVNLLLNYGARINDKSGYGYTVLYEAVMPDTDQINPKFINFLLSRGADPSLRISGGFYAGLDAIDLARQKKHEKLAGYLMVAPELRKNAIRAIVTEAIEKKCGRSVPEIAVQVVDKMIALEAD